jgi:cobalamin biosynthesis Mg chelatase CobN
MTYDSSVLALASNVNKRTVCPTIGDAVVNFDVPGEIYFNVSNLNLYDFSSEEADNILVTVTFDVIGASEAVSETTVNLDVEVLQLSLLDENFEVIVEEEVTLVADHVLDRNAAANVNAQTSAEFAPTDFDYVPGTDEPSSDEPSSDEPSSDEPSSDEPSSDEPSSDEPSSDEPSSDEPSSDAPSSDAPSSDAPSSDAPSSDDTTVPAPSTDDADSSVDDSTLAPSTSDSVEGDNGTVQTGEATLAIIMLLVLASATAFLYFTRKRTV